MAIPSLLSPLPARVTFPFYTSRSVRIREPDLAIKCFVSPASRFYKRRVRKARREGDDNEQGRESRERKEKIYIKIKLKVVYMYHKSNDLNNTIGIV